MIQDPAIKTILDRLAQLGPSSVGVKRIYLEPFDRPKEWAEPVQRSSGSKDERISKDKTYFAKIFGHWYFGRFSEQWYGWSFNNWGTSGIQLDSIEDLYEVDISSLN